MNIYLQWLEVILFVSITCLLAVGVSRLISVIIRGDGK